MVMVHGNGFGNGVDQKLDGVTTFAPDCRGVWYGVTTYSPIAAFFKKCS